MRGEPPILDPVDQRNVLIGDVLLRGVHPIRLCSGRVCVIHNPSDHHMRLWPVLVDDPFVMVRRVCEHGVVHPDPDEAARPGVTAATLVHVCDGCCRAGD